MVIDPGGVGKNRLNARAQDASSSTARTAAPAPQTAPTATTEKSPGGPKDSVVLSGAAKAMHRLEGRIRESSEFNSAKVAELKQSITAGTYKPNPSAIADKLLADF